MSFSSWSNKPVGSTMCCFMAMAVLEEVVSLQYGIAGYVLCFVFIQEDLRWLAECACGRSLLYIIVTQNL